MSKLNYKDRVSRPLNVKTRTLSGGARGNLETVQFMRQKARELSTDPHIRSRAIAILNGAATGSHDEIAEAVAIGDYVKNKVGYVKDPTDVEHLTSPLTLLDQIDAGLARGDCDDMSLLIATLLLAIGHRPVFRIVRYAPTAKSNEPYNHIYVVDYPRCPRSARRRRVVLDAIFKDRPIGYETDHFSAAEIAI